jgi:hypothetical protein
MGVFRRRDGRSAPVGPQRSGGRRQPSFLARAECAPAQGKKVGGSRCRDKAGRRQTRYKERAPGWLRTQSFQRERRRISNATGRERLPPAPACHNEQGRHSAEARHERLHVGDAISTRERRRPHRGQEHRAAEILGSVDGPGTRRRHQDRGDHSRTSPTDDEADDSYRMM